MRALIGLGLGVAFAATPLSDTQRLAAQQASVVSAAEDPWTREELENLLAPIALYPDPILAQVLVAATYPDQVQAAAAYVQRYGTEGLDNQPWEISVKAVAHYAPVLNLMAEGEDWMVAVGQAYAEQPRDVMDAVQGLRRMANAQGNLVTTQQQKVIVEREVIRIEPAQPRVVYVPTYDPAVVYFRPIHVVHAHPAYWAWGVGFPIGVWLTYDVDWWGHRVYYHGWHTHGPRWVVVSRPWVALSPIYVAPRHTTVIVNRTIVHRRFDPRPLRRYTVVHKHTTFDRRGTPRRDVGRDDRRDWDRGRDNDRRDWDRGRGNNGRNDANPGRGDERRDWNRGNGNGERRVAPVPMGGTRVADRGRGTPGTAPAADRRVTPIASGSRPSPSGGAASPARSGGATPRATPSPVGTRAAAPRASGGTAVIPDAARRARESQPTAGRSSSAGSTGVLGSRGVAAPTRGNQGAAEPRRPQPGSPSASPSRSGGQAAPARGSQGGGRSAAPARGSQGGGGSAAPARGSQGGGRSAAPARGGQGGGRSAAPARGSQGGGRSAAPARGSQGGGRRGGGE